MAKLIPVHIRIASRAGDESINYKAEVSVTSEGVFSVQVPDHLQDELRHFAGKALSGSSATFDRNQRHSACSAKTLDAAKAGVMKLLEEYLACEVTTDLVIVYKANVKYSLYRHEDGTIHPNGEDDPRVKGQLYGAGRWKGNLNASEQASEFSLGLAARVLKRTTYLRASGSRETFGRPDESELGPHGVYLNRFVGYHLNGTNGAKVIPYSEEAAAFFGKMILGLASMANRVEEFFSSEQSILEAVRQQATIGMTGLRQSDGQRHE